MSVVCRRCAAPVPASELNMLTLVARCTACNVIFDFTDQMAAENAARRSLRAPLPMPPNFTLIGEASAF